MSGAARKRSVSCSWSIVTTRASSERILRAEAHASRRRNLGNLAVGRARNECHRLSDIRIERVDDVEARGDSLTADPERFPETEVHVTLRRSGVAAVWFEP